MARTRHSYECNVLFCLRERVGNLEDALARDLDSGVGSHCLRCLRHEHEEASRAWDAELFRLQHETGSGGIVDDIHDCFEAFEPSKINRGVRAGRVHPHGRGIHDEMYRSVCIKIIVCYRAGASHGDGLTAQVFKHGHAGSSRAAAPAEHERALSGYIDTGRFDECLEAEVIGVAAAQPSVWQAYDGVHVAQALRACGELVEVWYDGAFVGYRHVHARPFVSTQERLHFFWFAFEAHVFDIGKHGVNAWRVAVAERAAQHAVGRVRAR